MQKNILKIHVFLPLKQNIRVLGLQKLSKLCIQQAREILKIKKRQLESTQEKIKFKDINEAYWIHKYHVS